MIVGGALVAGGGLSGLLSACGDKGAAPTSVTEQDVRNASGTISVTAFSFYEAPELNAGPVKAKYTDLGTTIEIVSKIRPVNSGFDVSSTGPNLMRELFAIDRLIPLDTELLTNYAALDPSVRDDPLYFKDGAAYAVPFMVSVGFTAWDSDKVPEPKSADDLLDPVYKDSIALLDGADVLIFIDKLLGFDNRHFTLGDLEKVKAYFEELKPNIKTLFAFGDEVQLFGRGDIAVAYQTYGSLLNSAQKANPAVKGNFLGSNTYADSWSIVKGADVAASLNWINNAISLKGQRALAESSGGFPPLGRARNPSLDPGPLHGLTPKEVLSKSPVNPGVPVEGDGLVTQDILENTWSELKASFG